MLNVGNMLYSAGLFGLVYLFIYFFLFVCVSVCVFVGVFVYLFIYLFILIRAFVRSSCIHSLFIDHPQHTCAKVTAASCRVFILRIPWTREW